MKNIKSHIKLIAVSLLVMGLAASTQAAFAPVDTFTRTAEVTIGGTPDVSLTIEVRDLADQLTPGDQGNITWANGVQASDGIDGWVLANRIVHIDATLTQLNSGVQTYTNNKDNSANPRYVDETPAVSTDTNSNGAGLIFTGDGATTSRPPLPMAWAIHDSTKVPNLPADQNGITAADPNKSVGPQIDPNAFQWHFYKDKGTTADIPDLNATAFQNAEPFITMLDDALGFHFGQRDGAVDWGGSASGEKYVFIQALLNNALPQQTYRTNTLTIESFTE